MVINRPPMGWNSWNTFAENINEKVVMETADFIVESGLKDCGYEYVIIDDCWSLRERNEKNEIVPDPEKFPHGMKYVSDYIHSKGLKFGMYSCAGTMTCAAYPGSLDHEFIDAKCFAECHPDALFFALSVGYNNRHRSLGIFGNSFTAEIILDDFNNIQCLFVK